MTKPNSKPHGNTGRRNAAKGDVNRRPWTGRLPVPTIERLAASSEQREISQADVVALAVDGLPEHRKRRKR